MHGLLDPGTEQWAALRILSATVGSAKPASLDVGKTATTVTEFLDHWVGLRPDSIWLRDRHGNGYTDWTWKGAQREIRAVAAWLELEYGDQGARFAILSRNRAHWIMADLAIAASGNVSVPLFTNQPGEVTRYILDFAGVELLFIGETENWEEVSDILPAGVRVVRFSGEDVPACGSEWDDIVETHRDSAPRHRCQHDELLSIVFTSGTTGRPKGVMQTHDSMLVPMLRCKKAFTLRQHPRFLSYLPMSHVAERQLVLIQSLIYGGEITVNEALPHLLRDLGDTRPNYFFGAPRVWEQLQQAVLAHFGSQEALDQALNEDQENIINGVRGLLGLQDFDYLLTASAPTPPALISWYDRLGIRLCEGYGQTEAMGLIANSPEDRRIGSVGKPIGNVEIRIDDSGELLVRAPGLAVGYFRMPEETAETFVNGWVRTGDRARVDEDDYYYITGRVKEYFKTIQGKFVAPAPIESAFARSRWVDQQCLLGRGFSRTVMVCVPSALAGQEGRETLEEALRNEAAQVNESAQKHERIGAIIVTTEPWTVANGFLTPTLKLRREQVEARFGERAEPLAREAAERGELLVEWTTDFPPG
jgi:long-chain acyl-CoA synthetase